MQDCWRQGGIVGNMRSFRRIRSDERAVSFSRFLFYHFCLVQITHWQSSSSSLPFLLPSEEEAPLPSSFFLPFLFLSLSRGRKGRRGSLSTVEATDLLLLLRHLTSPGRSQILGLHSDRETVDSFLPSFVLKFEPILHLSLSVLRLTGWLSE